MYNKENIQDAGQLIRWLLFKYYNTLSKHDREDIEQTIYAYVIKKDIEVNNSYISSMVHSKACNVLNHSNRFPATIIHPSIEETRTETYHAMMNEILPALSIDERRLLKMLDANMTQDEISSKFRLTQPAVHYRTKALYNKIKSLLDL